MRKCCGIAVAGLLAALSLVGAPAASGATEFGDNCGGNSVSEAPVTYFALTAAGNPLSLAAPSAGVITKWKSTLAMPVSLPATLKVLRRNGVNTVQIVGESNGSLVSGLNTFDARIPVQAGDLLGISGSGESGTPFCDIPGPEDLFGGFFGGSAGQTVGFLEVTDEAGIPIAAVLEPDADSDGFGDETQDKCPQLASAQTACPLIAVNAVTGVKRKGAVVVLITTDNAAPVTVTGTVNLGKGRKAKLSSKAKAVTPGTVTRFTLKFPKKLKAALEDLARKRSLKLKVIASATNVLGQVTSDKLKVSLKGQAKG